ncbi:MAG: FAD-dependent oxidoreductase [Oscillospiraceae bacterium]|nr:FAD-dependent oxidoreductase [Oscillospiraceae bacterium]
MYDIVIVGGGPAGLTAAVYALRAGRSVVVVEKNGFGGQIAFSPKVENIPGTIQISGAEFADKLVEQAMNLGADMELEAVTHIEKTESGFTVFTEEGSEFCGKTVILALGVKHRMLGLEGEYELIGNGISFCAVCDGAFYTDQEVAMVGGGNSALQEALLLSEVCSKVTIVQNLADFTGEKKLAEAIAEKDNVEVFFNTVVTSYQTADGALTGLTLKNEQTGEISELKVDGAFLAVGLMPENDAFAQFVPLNNWGYFDCGEDCLTPTPGLFVAGDCRSKRIRQVVTASADGAVAATAACMYLDQNK